MRSCATAREMAFIRLIGLLFVLAGFTGLSSGCSVVLAAKQPDAKDMSVLKEGAPRSHVIAALGAPAWSGEKDGAKADMFSFKQGYSTGAKVGRAFFHGVADVFTLGLWEVVGTPIEMIASGTDTRVEVIYDREERVKTFTVTEPKTEAPPTPQDTTPGPVGGVP